MKKKYPDNIVYNEEKDEFDATPRITPELIDSLKLEDSFFNDNLDGKILRSYLLSYRQPRTL